MKTSALQVFLTPKQIVAELGVDYRHFMRKLARGEGPKFKRYGTQYRIRKDWYDEWLEKDQKCSA
jgi:excisionase family DNA binding protein